MFEAAIRRSEVHGITGEFDHQSGYEINRLKILKPMPAARWGILVGDVVHQARAALDDLIELLNIRTRGHALSRTTFPIYPDRNAYLHGRPGKRGKAGSPPGFLKAGNVGREAAALIESFQPYPRGDDYASVEHVDKRRNSAIVGVGGHVTGVQDKARSASGIPTVYGTPDIIMPGFSRLKTAQNSVGFASERGH